MSKVFRITPKRIKRVNGTVLTPDMVITVTTLQRMYQFDYKRANCSKYDFDFVKLD